MQRTVPPVPSKDSPLRPLPMRITELQWQRLNGARSRDAISIQEHVRRALDEYLARHEDRHLRIQAAAASQTAAELPEFVRNPPSIDEANASLARATGANQPKRRKVVYR